MVLYLDGKPEPHTQDLSYPGNFLSTFLFFHKDTCKLNFSSVWQLLPHEALCAPTQAPLNPNASGALGKK